MDQAELGNLYAYGGNSVFEHFLKQLQCWYNQVIGQFWDHVTTHQSQLRLAKQWEAHNTKTTTGVVGLPSE